MSSMENISIKSECHDVTLVAGIDLQKIPAHRHVLEASSRYFAAFFGPNFSEGAQDEVLLKDIDGSTLKIVLDFIYSRQIEINDENVGQVVAAASGMELIALEQKCIAFWNAKLAIECCVEIFLYSDKFMLNELRKKSLEYICEQFENVPIDDMLHIDEKNLRELLKHNQIAAAETVIFDRFVQLIERKNSETFRFDSEFAQAIRLEHIPTTFLIKTIEPWCKRYNCIDIVLNEYHKRLLQPEAIRLKRCDPGTIYCASLLPGFIELSIQKYNFRENDWGGFKNIPLIAMRYNFGSIFLDGELFVMGGNFQGILSSVESYNVENLTRTTLPPMQDRRSNFTPICIGKYIYVFGGRTNGLGDANVASGCECFDTERRVWQQRSNMRIASKDYGAVELNGKIYVAGQNSFQCYDPESDLWSLKAGFIAGKSSLTKSRELLYAIESNWTVHRYDANRDEWMTIGNYGVFGTIAGTISYCNQIYVLCEEGEHEVLNMGGSCTLIRLNKPVISQSFGRYIFIK